VLARCCFDKCVSLHCMLLCCHVMCTRDHICHSKLNLQSTTCSYLENDLSYTFNAVEYVVIFVCAEATYLLLASHSTAKQAVI